eukprot:GHVS01028658.1.p1 GENE.GHVS01028658.1~~GHVS01028658.1.p1  ORF type:complete len:301 (+),score=18.93 GHVS01028658.1:17-919(+)
MLRVSKKTYQLYYKMALLRSGVTIPRVGFGTWQLQEQVCYTAVLRALFRGYRHVDTASGYGNECFVQSAIAEFRRISDNSEPIFLTSKASPKELSGSDGTYNAALRTLENLQVPTVDLYLLHWPGSPYHKEEAALRRNRIDCWKGLERLYQEGKARAIGVSNFLAHHLDQLVEDGAKVVPMVNQLEMHPLCVPHKVIEWATNHDMVLEAYSSLGTGSDALLKNPVVVSIAKGIERTPAQVLLRWGLQRGFVVLPKSKTEERIRENFEVANFELDQQDMDRLDSLQDGDNETHFCWDPRSV